MNFRREYENQAKYWQTSVEWWTDEVKNSFSSNSAFSNYTEIAIEGLIQAATFLGECKEAAKRQK